MKTIFLSMLALAIAAYSWRGCGSARAPGLVAVNTPEPERAPGLVEAEAAAADPSDRAEVPPIETSWGREIRELRVLAGTAPDAALRRVAEMADKHERKAAASVVCELIAARHPAPAAMAAWELDLGTHSDEAAENTTLERVATQWAHMDPSAALTWVATLPADDESRRDRLVRGIAAAMAERHPAFAAGLVSSSMSAGSPLQIEAALEVVRHWSKQDLAGAVAWVSVFPAGPLRERSVEELVDTSSSGQETPRDRP